MSEENHPYRDKPKLKVFCDNCKYFKWGTHQRQRCLAYQTDESDYLSQKISLGNPSILNKNNDCTKFKPTLTYRIFGSKVYVK